jgi:predicted nuclease of restriction endonuclease-like (RecB) superfamily
MKSHTHAAVRKRISARERGDARNRAFDFESVVGAILNIHSQCIKHAERAVSVGLTLRNWAIGLYIFEYEQRGSDRAQYGARVLDVISTRLTRDGVDGVAPRSLRQYRQFYLTYPELCRQRIGASSSGTLSSLSIWQSVSAKLRELLPTECDSHNSMTFGPRVDPELLLSRLSFSHFAELITIEKQEERAFYEIECVRGAWSVRELKRQIGALYFERSAFSHDPQRLAGLLQSDAAALDPKFSFRDPYVFEFLGLRPPEVMGESDLEDALLDRLQAFMLELGHGFCFEARQKRIQIGDTTCFIDLVFYHRILKCHVLIELKVADFSHEHLGQLNTYVSWYKRNMNTDGDSPPIGLLLCKRKDNALVHYALADLPNTVFVSKYQVELPTVDQLRNLLNAPAAGPRLRERHRVEPPAP